MVVADGSHTQHQRRFRQSDAKIIRIPQPICLCQHQRHRQAQPRQPACMRSIGGSYYVGSGLPVGGLEYYHQQGQAPLQATAQQHSATEHFAQIRYWVLVRCTPPTMADARRRVSSFPTQCPGLAAFPSQQMGVGTPRRSRSRPARSRRRRRRYYYRDRLNSSDDVVGVERVSTNVSSEEDPGQSSVVPPREEPSP